MVRHRGTVLVDTNVILEAHRTGSWRALTGGYAVETVEDCVTETWTGFQRRRAEHQLVLVKVQDMVVVSNSTWMVAVWVGLAGENVIGTLCARPGHSLRILWYSQAPPCAHSASQQVRPHEPIVVERVHLGALVRGRFREHRAVRPLAAFPPVDWS